MGVFDVLDDVADFARKTNPLTAPFEVAEEAAKVPRAAGRAASKGERRKKWKSLKDGQQLSAQEVAQMWVDAGGREADAALASVISKYESGRIVGRYNDICCWGLMQVNEEAHGARYGARGNEWDRMRKAVSIRRAAGGWGPNPWEVCHDKKCSNLQDEAKELAKNLNLGSSFTEDIGALADKLDPVDNLADVIGTVLKPIADFFKIITDADTWIRAGKVLFGALVLLFALIQLSGGARQLLRKVKPV